MLATVCNPPKLILVCDFRMLFPSPLQKLHAVKGLSEAKAEKMVEAARKVTNVGDWQTGTDCMLRVSVGS